MYEDLEFAEWGSPFCNAITARAHKTREGFTSLSTHLYRETGNPMFVTSSIPVDFGKIQANVRIPVELNPMDFIVDPINFIIRVPDNWRQITAKYLIGEFDAPAEVKYLPGIRFMPVESFQRMKAFGSIEVKENPAASTYEFFVGNRMIPLGKLCRQSNHFAWQDKGESKSFPSLEGLRKHLIQLSKCHKSDEEYFDGRQKYLENNLDSLF